MVLCNRIGNFCSNMVNRESEQGFVLVVEYVLVVWVGASNCLGWKDRFMDK